MYKAFEDYYRDASIKHLILGEHQGYLISPPFSTDNCKDYSKIAVFEEKIRYIDLKIPPATSKINAMSTVNDSLWMIPYGIYDEFNAVIEIKDFNPTSHQINKKGKGQFYSSASNGKQACSFPLGYSETQFFIFIDNNGLQILDFPSGHTKCHMGVVYCNNRFWSMPRGDTPGYQDLVSYDGKNLKKHEVPVNPEITRKFTDAVVFDNKIFSLPFGETSGLTKIIEFDTETESFNTYGIDIPDFAKKFNTQILVGTTIIGLPYGDEKTYDSNFGITFDVLTKKVSSFKIKESYGGKYRYRSAISFKNHAVFFPTGTVNLPIYKITPQGGISIDKIINDILFGRPVIYKDHICCIGYQIDTKKHFLYTFDENLKILEKKLI